MEKVINKTQEIRRGDIFFADLNYMNNDNKTSIQQGERPVICLSNNMCNTHSPVITIVPLTSNLAKQTLKTQVFIPKYLGTTVNSVALCEQQQSIDKSRLIYKMGECDAETMAKIEDAILVQVGMKETKNQIINIIYVKELIMSISQLERISKETNQPIKARKMLLDELIGYCNSFGRDYREIVNELKATLNKERVISCV